VFDLYQIHPKECDIGMGWTANFCDAIPEWRKPENLDRAIDRFLLYTMAYGHIGWLVEEEHGIARTCRSYYMLQQVQARYGLKTPTRIAYWDGTNLVSTSEALIRDLPRTRRQLFVEYPGGLQLWLNDHPSENWRIRGAGVSSASMPVSPALLSPKAKNSDRRRDVPPTSELVLPPAGWAAYTKNGELFSFSALAGTNRVDYLRSPDYTYLDGRGHWLRVPEAASDGALAIRPMGKDRLQIIRISGAEAFTIRRPYRMQGRCVSCEAFDLDGNRLTNPICHEADNETRIVPEDKAMRFVLRFGP
jgi:hypothetical protein